MKRVLGFIRSKTNAATVARCGGFTMLGTCVRGGS